MLTITDPIFAAIDAHKAAVVARWPILDAYINQTNDDPRRAETLAALDLASEAEATATIELRNIRATTFAGLMALTTYYGEHTDKHHDWIGGEDAGDLEGQSFEAGLIRSLSAAMVQISGQSTAV